MEEIWRDIVGYEGYYEVSNLGRIRCCERIDKIGRHKKSKILKLYKQHDGYLRICLHKDCKQKKFLVHRLVAETFIPNENESPEVNHINGKKDDNRVENLEWITREENMLHAFNTGLATAWNKKKVICIETGEIFESTSEAERIMKLCVNKVSAVCRGVRKSTGGYTFMYYEDYIDNKKARD